MASFNFNFDKPLGILILVLTAVVTLALLAGVTGSFFTNLQAVNDNITTATTGDATADSILAIFPLVIGVGGVVAFVSLVFIAFRMSRNN
jgi:hypothetical protein